MSTERLNQEQKDWVIQAYLTGKLSQLQIAKIATVSPRTIRRTLVKAGLATPKQLIHSEAMAIMQLLKKHDITVATLKTMINQYKKEVKTNENS